MLTDLTVSMSNAKKHCCEKPGVEAWFHLLLKNRHDFLGVKNAYFHTVSFGGHYVTVLLSFLCFHSFEFFCFPSSLALN